MKNTLYGIVLIGLALATSAWGQSSGHGWPTFNCAVNDTYKDVDSGLAWLCGPTVNTWKPNPQYQPWATGGTSGTVTLENVYSAPGSFTFAHNLNALFPQVTCYTRVGGSYGFATWSASAIDANDTSITVPSAGDYICAFSSTAAIAADFLVAVSPTTLLYEPTMTGTQQPTYTVNQTAVSGYTGTATYTATSLASGMTGAFVPTTITGTGSNVLTLSFPANQAAATTAFTVTGTDGSKIHTASPSITVGNINSGLVECWAMTDGAGTTFADSCGTANTETIAAGTLTWASNAGLPGTTATFSGTAYATGTNQTATNFNGAVPFSVSAWISVNSTANGRTIASSLDTAANFIGWEFSTDFTGGPQHLHAFIVNTYPGNSIEVNSACAVSTSTLHYVAMTYDGSKTAAGVTFYLDGSACVNGTVTNNSLTGTTANTKNVAIGGRVNGTDPVNSVLAYVRIYNRVLSSTDVSNYFTAGAR